MSIPSPSHIIDGNCGRIPADKEFSYRGKLFHFYDFPKLVPKPLSIPILFGSSGDKMLGLAGRIADGVILNSIGAPEYFKHAISVVRDSAKDAGKDQRQLEIAASIILSTADKVQDAIDSARHDVLFYVLYPELGPVIEKTPYVHKVSEIRKANASGDSKKAFFLVSDDMVTDLAIIGTPKECRNKVRKLYDMALLYL